jgi:hypothetical protein
MALSKRRGLFIGAAAVAAAAAGGFYAWTSRQAKPASTRPVVRLGNGSDGPKGMAWVPGGEFLMGSDHKLAQANERPTHRVTVTGFWMDTTHVTNDQFAEFIKATGYRTTAERRPTGKP